MSILLPASAVAFAASCVWLAVRIVNRRERWAKWTLAGAVGLPVLYVLSMGPVDLILFKLGNPRWFIVADSWIYAPLRWSLKNSPKWLADLYTSYYHLWIHVPVRWRNEWL